MACPVSTRSSQAISWYSRTRHNVLKEHLPQLLVLAPEHPKEEGQHFVGGELVPVAQQHQGLHVQQQVHEGKVVAKSKGLDPCARQAWEGFPLL